MSFLELISFFWFVRTIKFVLFWIYLWQLKEYHIGRFVDHFTTHKGKKLVFNFLLLVKIILLPLLLINILFAWALLAVYLIEDLVFGLNIIKRSVKKPKLTPKTILLVLVSFVVVGLFFFDAYQASSITNLLLFDIFTPLIISIVVLLIQPLLVMARKNILKKATQKMAQFPKLKVIAITGSYGKTSTKEFLHTILSSKFNVISTPEHKNSEMGIAQTILKDVNDKHEIFIVEMGSYNKGGIKLLCDIVQPEIGMVTGVNQQHLATFGSLENLLSAEGGQELLDHLPKHGLLVVNGDNKYCLDLFKSAHIRKQLYSIKNDVLNSDIWTEDIMVKKEAISFIARTGKVSSAQGFGGPKGEMAHFDVNVLGRQNIQNMLGAILVAKEMGMSFEEIVQASKNIKQKQAGMTLVKGIYGINIIDSSYSSNPDGVMADLDYLTLFGKENDLEQCLGDPKKVVVMPCLIELGSKSIEVHIQIGEKIAKTCDMVIVTTKDKFKEIKIGAMAGGMREENILLCDKPKEILHHITTFCKNDDAVLLEGRVPGELIRLLHAK